MGLYCCTAFSLVKFGCVTCVYLLKISEELLCIPDASKIIVNIK